MSPDTLSRRALLQGTFLTGLAAALRRSSETIQSTPFDPPRKNSHAVNVVLYGDSHLEAQTELLDGPRAYEALVTNADSLREEGYDMVVHLGDISHDTGKPQQDLNNLKKGIEASDQTAERSVAVLGNHDYWIGNPADVEKIAQNSGRGHTLRGVIRFDFCTLAWIGDLAHTRTTEGTKRHGTFAEDAISWFLNTTHPEEKIFLFSHYPMTPLAKEDTWNTEYFRGNPEATALTEGEKIRDSLIAERTVVFVGGHRHTTEVKKLSKAHELVIPSLAQKRTKNSKDIGEYGILEITPKGFALSTYLRERQLSRHEVLYEYS